MQNLTEVLGVISSKDAELLEKRAELYKQAEEEEAAGRIMARGFADELHKLAQDEMPRMSGGTATPLPTPGGTVKAAPFKPAPTGPAAGGAQARPGGAPKVPGPGGSGNFTGGNLNVATGQLAGRQPKAPGTH